MKACGVPASSKIPVGEKPRRAPRIPRIWVILGVMAGLVASVFFYGKEKEAQRRSRAFDGMKMFGLALIEFDQEFGAYPSDVTADDVGEDTGTELPLIGNEVMNQLRAFGDVGSLGILEEVARSEGSWMYFPGANQCSNPRFPLLVSPPIGGERYVLRVDNLVGVLTPGELDDLPEYLGPPVNFPNGSPD